jgi:hypothetical protein
MTRCRTPGLRDRATEEVVGDVVAWRLLLLGVVFVLGVLGAVELLTRLGSL